MAYNPYLPHHPGMYPGPRRTGTKHTCSDFWKPTPSTAGAVGPKPIRSDKLEVICVEIYEYS